MSNNVRYNQLWQITSALFREIIREPGVLFWGILFPILMSIGLGVAFTKKADVIRKVSFAADSTATFRSDTSSPVYSFLSKNCIRETGNKNNEVKWKLTLKDEKLGNSIFYFYKMDWRESMMQLKRGTVNVVLAEKNGVIEYHFDPLNPDAQLTYLKLHEYIGGNTIIQSENSENIKPLTITGTRYIDFLVPGLISMGVMMSCLWGISYGIIEKRSKKLLRRLVATPMKKSHFLISLITVRVGMNFIESFVLFIFALIAFKMTVQGNLAALFFMFLSGNIAFSGIAIFISSHTAKTEVGNGLINFVVFPMMVLSGIFFSYHNFPDWAIPVIQKLPLTMLTDGIRGIFNEGAGFNEAAIPIIVLTTIGVIFFSAGLRIFKWH